MEETAAFNRDCHPGNIALFGRNLAGPGATARLIDDIKSWPSRMPQ
jgi:hypothetical protein